MLKLILIILGSIFVFLGVVGIFLPLLPTTPFLLLATYCYMKGSKKLHTKLINNKYLGVYIKNYYEKKGIPLKGKIISLCLLWFSIGYSIIILDNVFLQIFILLISTLVTIHILKQKTIMIKGDK